MKIFNTKTNVHCAHEYRKMNMQFPLSAISSFRSILNIMEASPIIKHKRLASIKKTKSFYSYDVCVWCGYFKRDYMNDRL